MLHAIENNKAGRNFSSSEIAWKRLFTTSEDSLTSSVLGTLLYLPENIIWSILLRATGCNLFDSRDNLIQEIVFWPSWNAKDTSNQMRVEPDIYLRTLNFDLIIEAKKENVDHLYSQWVNECIAYKNEFGHCNRKLVFFALGGEVRFTYEKISLDLGVVDVIQCRWRDLLYSVRNELESLQSNPSAVPSFLTRIFSDINKAFRIHGFYQIEWLLTLKNSLNLGIDDEANNYLLRILSSIKYIPSNLANFKINNNSINTLMRLSYE
jgi:hypothetical protein